MRQSLSQLIKFRSPKARNDAILAGVLTLLINVIIKSAALSGFGQSLSAFEDGKLFFQA